MLQETIEFFGLTKLPTQTGIYYSDQLRSATASLHAAINQGVGLVALLGPSGVGKTRLLDRLWQDAKAGTSRYLVAKINVPDKGQLKLPTILSEMIRIFGLRDRRKVADRYAEIEEFLLKAEKRVILLIDEAHRLNTTVLDLLRMFTDHEVEENGGVRKLLTIILGAQAKLRWQLRSGSLQSTSWRILDIWLDPLGKQLDDYLSWILTQCGTDRRILLSSAREEIKKYAITPGEIKSLLLNALQMAYVHGEEALSAETIRRSTQIDPNNLLAKINKQGFTVRDVALQADCSRTIAEKVLKGIYRGKADSKERIILVADNMLTSSASPLQAFEQFGTNS